MLCALWMGPSAPFVVLMKRKKVEHTATTRGRRSHPTPHQPPLKPHKVVARQLCKSRMFSAQQPNCKRRFLETEPEFLHTCSVTPCRPVDEGCFFVVVFVGNLGSLRPEFPPKNKRSLSQKRRKNTTLGFFIGFALGQPVELSIGRETCQHCYTSFTLYPLAFDQDGWRICVARKETNKPVEGDSPLASSFRSCHSAALWFANRSPGIIRRTWEFIGCDVVALTLVSMLSSPRFW